MLSTRRASLPLQVAAAAELIGSPQLRDHALSNFLIRRGERPCMTRPVPGRRWRPVTGDSGSSAG